jgi:hypothetical protein
MPLTPVSSTAPYLLPQDVIDRHDWQLCGQLLTDDPINGPFFNSIALVLASPVLYELCRDASGKAEAYFLTSNRYQVADLQALMAAGGNGANLLKKYLSDFVMMELFDRRGGPDPPATIVKAYEEAIKYFEGITTGVTVLPFAETQQAGVPVTIQLQNSDYAMNNLLTYKQVPMWGIRNAYRRVW